MCRIRGIGSSPPRSTHHPCTILSHSLTRMPAYLGVSGKPLAIKPSRRQGLGFTTNRRPSVSRTFPANLPTFPFGRAAKWTR